MFTHTGKGDSVEGCVAEPKRAAGSMVKRPFEDPGGPLREQFAAKYKLKILNFKGWLLMENKKATHSESGMSQKTSLTCDAA